LPFEFALGPKGKLLESCFEVSISNIVSGPFQIETQRRYAASKADTYSFCSVARGLLPDVRVSAFGSSYGNWIGRYGGYR
jgi:hypothetical protein